MANGSIDVTPIEKLLENQESEWLEFKVGNSRPDTIGKLCSALSNGAALADRDKGYVVWGVDDKTRQIKGTPFDPEKEKKGNDGLLFWLSRMLNPCPSFEFRTIAHPQGNLVILEVSAALKVPTAFDGKSYVRIGSATPELQKCPSAYERLIARLGKVSWEKVAAKSNLEQERVIELLDWEKYLERTKVPRSADRATIFDKLEDDALVRRNDAGKWDITNLGAVLFARNLSSFGVSMARKGVRLTVFWGGSKASKVKDRLDGTSGYAVDIESIMERINNHNPVGEEIVGLDREEVPLFPHLAIRELLVNALIHQNFHATGMGPHIYLYDNKLEIDNPGESLVLPPDRMLDSVPRSRNEALAGLMRRMRYCEEEGRGLIQVVREIESVRSPPPRFRVENGTTQVTLYGPRDFTKMTVMEMARACYQHTVMVCLEDGKMTNPSLRARLGLPDNQKGRALASNIIREAVKQKKIKPFDPDRPRIGYVPYWTSTQINGY